MKSTSILHSREKVLSATLLAILIVSSILSFIPLVMAVTPPALEDDYAADYGVLHNDTYILYPFEEESINIGFSKYGELINPEIPLGLKYKNVDAFASEALLPVDWSNGWLMDIHYVEDAVLKNVWAYALYSDREAVGGDWKQKQLSYDASAVGDEHGGRRTSGWCVTDPIRLVYDGPRRSIYLLRTTIYDDEPGAPTYGTAMIQLDIQLIFNKVKKYILEIKDIKRLERSKWTGPFQVEFSQRGEWDIGTTSVCNSYAEFYNNLTTKYDKHPFYSPYVVNPSNNSENHPAGYDLCQMISTESGVNMVGFWAFWPNLTSKWVDKTYGMPKSLILKSLETVEETFDYDDLVSQTYTTDYVAIKYPRGEGVWMSKPWLFKNGEEMAVGWSWDHDNHKITFTNPQTETDEFLVLYKKYAFGAAEHTTCLAEFGKTYGMSNEPRVPYVFGEWDFELSFNNEMHSTHHFRCVSVVGLTDWHDAEDPDKTGNCVIDSEVKFQLDEVFNPWDLNESAHKESFRWAQKGDDNPITLTSHLVTHPDYHTATCLDGYHVIVDVPWTKYSSDYLGRGSERVIVYDNAGVLPPLLLERGTDYTWSPGSSPEITITDWHDRDWYKVLYSTDQVSSPYPCWDTGRWEWIVVGRDSAAVDSAGAAMISAAWQEWKYKEVWLSAIDMKSTMEAPGVPYLFRIFDPDGTYKTDYYYNNTKGDYRAALKDDWCTPEDWDYTDEIYPYAISSSNIIVVGGPSANLGAEYFNDFTDAFVFSEYDGGFYSYACWARTSQPSINKVGHKPHPGAGVADELWYNSTIFTDDVGQAIVSTYLDLNGTIGFIVYGYTADDTYYASYAVRGGLLPWLQEIQKGVTTLILEFNYTSLHPVGIHVAECLGTITECTGFGTNFKTHQYEVNIASAKSKIEMEASSYGLCYKLVDIEWCAELHPDP